MKKKIISPFFIFLLVVVLVKGLKAQTSVEGKFDTLVDGFGNKFSLNQISLNCNSPFGRPVPTLSCSSGYFDLYFAPNSLFANSVASRTLLCQLMSDISNFIISPLSGNSTRVKIHCSDLPIGSTANARATSFFSFPSGPANPNQGIIDNQLQKTVLSGIDAYTNLPIIFAGSGGFYHAYLQVNPNLNWNYNSSSTVIATNEIDYYTIMLHEITHALGFGSMIGASGASLLGSSNNYYSRYDKFLFDTNGNPLLQAFSQSCPNSSITFVASPTAIATATSGCATNITNCGSAVQYSSATTNVKVYTPNCFELGSSLSHFEDMCSIPNSPTLACATSTNPAANNDLYFVMANQAQNGSCYQKRYLRPEEKNVLCDLGYSVNTTYGSVVAGSNFTYTAACAGPNVWGVNDGLNAGMFTFTAIATVTNAIAIPISLSVTANDSPSISAITCLEVIYNNASVAQSGGSVVVTTAANYSGLVLIKYYPVSVTGVVGNATYIFAYFFPANCSANSCDLVYNGGFELNSGDCGGGIAFSSNPSLIIPRLNCWTEQGVSSPDYFSRGCTLTVNNATVFNLGSNVLNISPVVDSHNGAPNNGIIGQWAGFVNNSESFVTTLTSPISPSTPYLLDFWALNPAGYAPNQNRAVVITISSLPNATSLLSSTIANFTLFPSSVWSHITYSFNSSAAINHYAINIIANEPATAAISGSNTQVYYFYDDISIKPLPTVTFSIPNSTICGPKTYSNLSQFASAVPGTFTGGGVSVQGTGTNTTYQFNSTSSLAAGVYPIAFTYTNGGCVNTLWESIVIGPTLGLTVSNTNYCMNTAVPATITAQVSGTNSVYYTCQPGNLLGQTQVVTPTIATQYTVSAITNSCVV